MDSTVGLSGDSSRFLGQHHGFGEPFLIHQLIELINHLGQLVIHFDAMLAPTLDFLDNTAVVLIQLDACSITFNVRFGFLYAAIDAGQQLASRLVGYLRVRHFLPQIVQLLPGQLGLGLEPPTDGRLLLTDFGAEAAHLLGFGRR